MIKFIVVILSVFIGYFLGYIEGYVDGTWKKRNELLKERGIEND